MMMMMMDNDLNDDNESFQNTTEVHYNNYL